MSILKVIDGLFIGTRYGVWLLSLIGIPVALILAFVNMSLGMVSALVFVAALFGSLGVMLILLPKQFVSKSKFFEKRFAAGSATLVIALIMIGTIYFTQSGFPEINLLFI